MAKAIHMMIRVREEARSVAFYRTTFGLEPVDRFAFAGFTLVYLANAESGFELELTINHDRDQPYDLGDGYGHVAMAVADLDREHARLLAAGLSPTPIKELAHHDQRLARFCFLQDPDGYKIELLQQSGRYR
jgi:lactoylglutathione lyase